MLKVQQCQKIRDGGHGGKGERCPRPDITNIPPEVVAETTTLLKGEMSYQIDRLSWLRQIRQQACG